MIFVIAIAIAAVALSCALVFALPYGRRVLLGWYLREVRRVAVAEAPGEAIVTYPLA